MKLRNGVEIPDIALGTFRSEPEQVKDAVVEAIKAGYRHIDTAMIYHNEEAIGEALQTVFEQKLVKREELFITTKLWNSDQGYESTLTAFQMSLEKLGLNYIDLYLIHWPKGYELASSSWRAMEELYREGKVRAIGVSNFNIHHLEHLFATANILPMVNQVECHVELQNHVLNDFCLKYGVQLEAYAPLMSHEMSTLLNNEVLAKIASKHNASIPQIALAWLKSRGIVSLPKSITASRIKENLESQTIQLSDQELRQIRELNRGNRIFAEPDNTDF